MALFRTLMFRRFLSSSQASKMRAVVCPRAPIAPSELVYTTDHPEPKPKEGHVLIRVKAYGLNRSELFTRQGHSPGIQFPRVLGIECVGIVKDAGGGSKWKEGDVVAACMGGMGRQFDGTYLVSPQCMCCERALRPAALSCFGG